MKQYLEIVEEVLSKGVWKDPAREGMPKTLSRFVISKRFDLQEGFPLLTTKKMFFRGVVHELIWFLRGDTCLHYLHKNGVHKLWHEDGYKFYLKELAKNDIKVRTYEEWFEALDDRVYALEFGSLGPIYSHQWRRFSSGLKVVNSHNVIFDTGVDQIVNVIEDIKNNPFGRYKVVTAWNPGEVRSCALPPCHMLFQFNCRPMDTITRIEWAFKHGLKEEYKNASDGKGKKDAEWAVWCDEHKVPKFFLDCALTQRSCDTGLGVPFNIASYALLTMVIAQLTGTAAGDFIWTGNDVHIYEDHMEGLTEQLKRKPLGLPSVKLSAENWKCVDDVTFDDISLVDYASHPKIDLNLSVGS